MDERIRFGNPIEFPVPFEALPSVSLISQSDVQQNEPFQVYVLADVYNQVWEHVQSSPNIESGGVLVGYPFKVSDQSITFVIIAGAIPQSSNNRGIAHFTVGPEEVAVTRTLQEQKFPGLITVGWYHSHPGHGVFLSQQDMVIVRSIYNLPWHLALVVDPKRGEAAFFFGPNGTRLHGFNILSRLPASVRAIALYNQAQAWRQANQAERAEPLAKEIGVLVNSDLELSHWRQHGGYRDLGDNHPVAALAPNLVTTPRLPQPARREEKRANILESLLLVFGPALLVAILMLIAISLIENPLPLILFGSGIFINVFASYAALRISEQSRNVVPYEIMNGHREFPDYTWLGIILIVLIWLAWFMLAIFFLLPDIMKYLGGTS